MERIWYKRYTSESKLFDFNLKELWEYRDLAWLLVKRDFKTLYTQTILGPLWVLVVPILTTLMQVLVFGNIAGISTDGTPSFLFYLASNCVWLFFSGCITKTADTFVSNSSVFGKVYFPRLINPIATVVSETISFSIQFLIFFVFDVYFISKGLSSINSVCFITPLLVLVLACLGLGCGIIVSSLTTKYRDLRVVFTFIVQLVMYMSAIIYPVSAIPEKYYNIIMLNPIVPIVECFRYAFTGHGQVSFRYLTIGIINTTIILIVGILLFNKIEKNFTDTI